MQLKQLLRKLFLAAKFVKTIKHKQNLICSIGLRQNILDFFLDCDVREMRLGVIVHYCTIVFVEFHKLNMHLQWFLPLKLQLFVFIFEYGVQSTCQL